MSRAFSEIIIRNDGTLNAMSPPIHYDLTHVWTTINLDPLVLAVVLRGHGGTFSAGGDYNMIRRIATEYNEQVRIMRETLTQLYNFINCQKPTISAIEGSAAGAGLCLALLADISVVGRNAQLIDPHTRLGVPAGDHAAIAWPILCGLAKAKYYLFTNEPIRGEEADRIGMVSLCVDDDAVVDRARTIAEELTHRSQYSLSWTKYAMNSWLRLVGPTFDLSLALEMLGFAGPEPEEGVEALREKRRPETFNDPALLRALAAIRPS